MVGGIGFFLAHDSGVFHVRFVFQNTDMYEFADGHGNEIPVGFVPKFVVLVAKVFQS